MDFCLMKSHIYVNLIQGNHYVWVHYFWKLSCFVHSKTNICSLWKIEKREKRSTILPLYKVLSVLTFDDLIFFFSGSKWNLVLFFFFWFHIIVFVFICETSHIYKHIHICNISNCQHPLDHWKSKRVPEKHPLLLYWLRQSLWLCGWQQTVENSSRGGNTRPPCEHAHKTGHIQRMGRDSIWLKMKS